MYRANFANNRGSFFCSYLFGGIIEPDSVPFILNPKILRWIVFAPVPTMVDFKPEIGLSRKILNRFPDMGGE
jgi:hypothetical protein